jgi:hypothetical protein
MRAFRVGLQSLVAIIGFFAAASSFGAQVHIYDRATGEILPTYHHKGRLYVAGEPGHEYEIRVNNNGGQRMLAVTSVDGVNVITGQTSAVSQSGYVLDPYGFVAIEGWRKSMSRTAAFYFTKLANSYAARTGRPDNVGVIGIALFRERVPCCQVEQEVRESVGAAQAAPSARSGASAADKTESLNRMERKDSNEGDSKLADSKLGTGHGRSEYSAAQYAEFERASTAPDETIVIYYDSARNLIAQGVIPSQQRYGNRMPQPFPGSFVPDP